jgi:hypothetical protein
MGAGGSNRSDDLFQELRDERIQGAAGEAFLTDLVYFVEQKGISSVEGTLHAFGIARRQSAPILVVTIDDERPPPIADIPGAPMIHKRADGHPLNYRLVTSIAGDSLNRVAITPC